VKPYANTVEFERSDIAAAEEMHDRRITHCGLGNRQVTDGVSNPGPEIRVIVSVEVQAHRLHVRNPKAVAAGVACATSLLEGVLHGQPCYRYLRTTSAHECNRSPCPEEETRTHRLRQLQIDTYLAVINNH
jgi:hypothetical protein